VVKIVFSHSKLRKQPFLLKISKSMGERPHPDGGRGANSPLGS